MLIDGTESKTNVSTNLISKYKIIQDMGRIRAQIIHVENEVKANWFPNTVVSENKNF